MCSGDTLLGKALGTATSAQTAINNKIQNFSNTLLGEAKTVFGDANQTFNTLTNQATSIFNGGPSQLGWSAGQTQATNADIVNEGATAARNLRGQVVGSALPGTNPTNSAAFITNEANIQNAQATAENKAVQENYQQGNQNWQNAGKILESAPGVFNAAQGYNTEAANELNTAQTSQKALDTQNNWVGGLVKGGLALGTDVLTGGGSGAMGAIANGLGNLDLTGGSTLGENWSNFISGAQTGGGTMPSSPWAQGTSQALTNQNAASGVLQPSVSSSTQTQI
jgi:hypothetical protein